MTHERVKKAFELGDELIDELEEDEPIDWLAEYRWWLERNVTDDVEDEKGRPKDVVLNRDNIEAFKEYWRNNEA